ncbi:MAG: hypothetical protein RKO24_17410 [Candidatus Competibacter sp.]|nr:hypothetical protein [Candidatus Competibacter sp.]
MKRLLRVFLVFLLSLTIPVPSNAAMCASVGVGDVLVVNATPVGQCETLIIMSASEWPGQSVYAVPTVQEAVEFWTVGFAVPMGIFLFSWGMGSVIRMWRLP